MTNRQVVLNLIEIEDVIAKYNEWSATAGSGKEYGVYRCAPEFTTASIVELGNDDGSIEEIDLVDSQAVEAKIQEWHDRCR